VFGALDDDEISTIAALGNLLTVPAGATVFEQGAPSEYMYAIVDGRVEVLHDGHPIAELTAGDFFGEMAMFNRAERVAAVRAVEETQLLAIADRQLQPLVLREDRRGRETRAATGRAHPRAGQRTGRAPQRAPHR
jgi:CRP-like cAMP-binding protein